MNASKTASIAFSALFAASVIGGGACTLLKAPDTVSKSERRELTQWKAPTVETVTNGEWFSDLDSYLLDQFPSRDGFRRIKSASQFYLFRQKENNKIVIKDGHAAEISYPLKEKAISVYIKRLNRLREKYFSGKNLNVYTTVIPDKIYYLADDVGCPVIDYDALFDKVGKEVDAKFINIADKLTLDSYYTTDTHWKESKIVPVADKLLEAMNTAKNEALSQAATLSPFYGVYYGQSALPLAPDSVEYLLSERLKNATVLRADKTTKKLTEAKLYYEENINAGDPYDIFLGGACTVTVIQNTGKTNGKTLYLFSDSFGRSLAPLLLSDYDKVVFYDIRYIRMSQALEIMPIEPGSDVLMAYNISAIAVSSNLQVD